MTAKIVVLAVLVFLTLCLGGCQVDLGGNVSMKGLYSTKTTKPDGTTETADPRRPMYEGSGYTERHGFGGETAEPVKKSGFKTLVESQSTEGGVR